MSSTGAKLTPQQQAAIDARRVSVALSAGAGCGKTFVLTERFLAHLVPESGEDPLELHQLVAITFTDRAAREMRDRIRRTCYERLSSGSADEAPRWTNLLRTLDTARVSTIHAFCGALLRAHAVEAQLDPQFAVLEQLQADTLLAEMIDDVLREQLASQDETTLELTVQFGLDGLREMLRALVAGGRTMDFDSWLSRSPAEVVAIWDRVRKTEILPAALQQLTDSPATRELLGVISHLGGAGGELGDRCDQLKSLLPKLPQSKKPEDDLETIAQSARVQGIGGKKVWPDETLYEAFKDSAERLRKEVKRAESLFDFDRGAAEASAKAGLDVLRLVRAVYDRYDARKRELSLLDFNDLLVRARVLLTDPAHAELQRRLAAQVRLLLVDECQDTDLVQVDLIKALCGERLAAGKLFFVGDYKQSIYRFRGADPGVFRRMQAETPREGQLPLTLNFRSQPAILDFVNAVFCDKLSGGTDQALAYEPLKAHREQVTARPGVEFLWSVIDDRNARDTGARDEARRKDAENVANRIRAMLDSGEVLVADEQADGSWQPCPVKQGDIAILFRTLSDVGQYEEALRRRGIEYYLVGGHAFYSQQEVFDVLNLSRSLASPADEVSLAAVLRSPMFALDDESLYWLAQMPGGLAAGLFQEKLPAEFAGEQRDRVTLAAATLRHLRASKDRLPIVGLLNEALKLTGYDAALLAEFMGERKLANLRKLVDQARTFDAAGVLSLADFIVQLSEFVAQQPREALAATHPEGTDVVRMMTIHQAKGLEFPVVFVPDVDRPGRPDDNRAVWSDKLGPLVKLVDAESSELTGHDLYRRLNAAEEENERFRVLYVATTRAADYLVLSSGIFDLEKPSGPWSSLLADRFDLKTGDCRARLPKGYDQPAVKVSLDLPASKQAGYHAPTARDFEAGLKRALQLSGAGGAATDPLAEPIAPDAAARRRFSISRLSGTLSLEDDLVRASVADDEELFPLAARGADFGTLVHAVLSRIEFGKTADTSALVRRFAEARGDNAESVESSQSCQQLIDTFLRSARARDLASATEVHRELEFVLAWPPAGFDGAGGAGVCLHGYIDCLYRGADDRWRLLDYKTTNVAASQIAAAAAPFELQLGVYALAVEQILGQAPAEVVVHFLRPSVEHRFTWDEEMRRRTIERVNQAIDPAVEQVGKNKPAQRQRQTHLAF